MTVPTALDAAGRRRSPATLPGYHAGRSPRNKGQLYPADPPTVEEIIAVTRRAPDDRHGARLRALIVVLWRAGLRVQEALALGERDLDARRGSLLVRQGKGGRRREIGMDAWGWEQLSPWLGDRVELPVGPLFCIIDGPTRGRSWSSSGSGSNSVGLPSRPVCGGVLRRISCATPTPSSLPAKAWRSTSSSASSATPTSARPASTSRASTPRRSSRRCTPDARR
jgi:Phage integrase family